MSVPHRKLSSASTASTSSLRQALDFEPDDKWKAATQKTIEDSLRFMIREAKEELQRKLDAEPNISSEQRAAHIEEYKRTENGIRKLAQEEFEHAVHKERMERRWAAGQAIPNQISEALRSEQQTILDSIQKSASGGEFNTDGNSTSNNSAPLSSPAPQPSASKPPDLKARKPTRQHSQQDSSDESEDDYGDESNHLLNHPERGKDSLYRSSYDSPVHLLPQSDRNVPKNHQIWKPSISPEEDALADSPHVIGRQVGRRASMTSIKSTGSLSFRPSSGHNSIPEFAEEVEHSASSSEREKAQTRLAEQQWSTLNRARDKEKTSQRSTQIEGRRVSMNDDNMRTPSPMTNGPTSPPPLPPLSTKPVYRPSSQASLLSASRPSAEPYPSPASANRYSGSNYGPEGPQRFQPPQIKPSNSSDSTSSGSYESPLPEHRYAYYGPSSYEEQRSYPTPSSTTRVSFPRRENEHYGPPYRDQEYPRPDNGPFRPPSGPPYQDYNDYRRPPSSGPEGPISSPYDYPATARRGWPIPDPVSYTGPYAPNYYDRGIPLADVSRRGSISESYRSRGSLEQGDEAWRYWKAERSAPAGGNQSDQDDELSDLQEDEHEEARQREEDRRRSEEEARKKEVKQKEEEARRKAEETRKREEARKREETRKREEEETRRREEEETRRREEEARKREEEEEALRRKEAEIKQKEADARKKEEDIRRKEEQAKKKEAEVKKKEAAARKKEEETKKKEAEVKKKEEDAKRREAEAARQAEEYRRREEEVKAKEEELRKREEELKRKEREMEERRRQEEKRRQQEEEDKRREQEELERLADVEEQKRLWQQVEREQEAKKEEQRRLEELKRQESDVAWNNLDAQKQKQEEKRRKEAEFERRQQDIHRRHEERQRQDSLGSDGIWPGSPTFSSTSSASSSTSKSTTTSATSASSGTPPSWTTWASSTPTNQTSASSRPSAQTTSTSKSPPNMSHASTPNAKSRTGGEPPPISQEEWQRRQEELARKQQEKFRLEQERLERERLQKAGTMLTKDDVIRLFDVHNRMWASLRAQANSELRWDSFPWPMIKKPSGPDDISYAAVDAYIFSPYYPEMDSSKSEKDRVKEHIRKWHPDRFDTKWLPNVIKKDQSLVKEGAGQVVRYLNDLLAKKNSPGLFS